MRAWRERDSPGLRRYTEAAGLLIGRDDATVKDAVDRLRGRSPRLTCCLAAVGLMSAQYAEVAEKAARASSMQGNPVRLSEDELVAVLHAAS